MERPIITISGDPNSRLKPMKPPARRTRRALRLSAPFLGREQEEQCSLSSLIPSLDHPGTRTSSYLPYRSTSTPTSKEPTSPPRAKMETVKE